MPCTYMCNIMINGTMVFEFCFFNRKEKKKKFEEEEEDGQFVKCIFAYITCLISYYLTIFEVHLIFGMLLTWIPLKVRLLP